MTATDSEIADLAIAGILEDADREAGWPEGSTNGQPDDDALLAETTRRELRTLRARMEAKRILDLERAEKIDIPRPVSLTDLLAEPVEPTRWRIENVWPLHGNIVLAAQYKAGKTTLIGNTIRSLADGDRFLGIYRPEQINDGTIVLIDFEMPRNKLQEWYADQAIVNTDRVQVWSLRGMTAAFDMLTETIRAQWVQRLKAINARVMVVDCMAPVFGSLGIDEDRNPEVGPILDAITAAATEAGVGEVLLVHHMGHGAERSRGASRLRDWPDAEWRLVRQRNEDNPLGDPDPAAPRFFTAFGRDVDVREGQLVYRHEDRRLLYAEGNRRQARANVVVSAVLVYVRDNPDRSGRQVESGVEADGIGRDPVRDALRNAVRQGWVSVRSGPKNSSLHSLTQSGYSHLASLPSEAN